MLKDQLLHVSFQMAQHASSREEHATEAAK